MGGQAPYPLRQCQFEFTQATDPQGRAAAKVRHGLLHLTLDVPPDDQLLDWANTVHKPLAGHVTFFEDDRRTARETLSFAAGQCVSYQESFVAGDAEVGAYVCQLIITSDGLSLAPGGPAAAFVAPTAREYDSSMSVVSGAAVILTEPVTIQTAHALGEPGVVPLHLPAPQLNPSPDHKQVYLSQAEWQELIKDRWDSSDKAKNKRFLKAHRQTEFHVAGDPFTYRTDAVGKMVAVYDDQKSYNVTGSKNGLRAIPLTLSGQPTYAGTPHLFPVTGTQRNVVTIKMAGNRAGDFRRANKEAGLIQLLASQGRDADEAPEGYTWHHRDDFQGNPTPPPYGYCTMELVETKAHEDTFVHLGSCNQCNKYYESLGYQKLYT